MGEIGKKVKIFYEKRRIVGSSPTMTVPLLVQNGRWVDGVAVFVDGEVEVRAGA